MGRSHPQLLPAGGAAGAERKQRLPQVVQPGSELLRSLLLLRHRLLQRGQHHRGRRPNDRPPLALTLRGGSSGRVPAAVLLLLFLLGLS